MSKLECHLFICTNSPDREGKCGHKGSEQLRQKVKEQLLTEANEKKVRVNAAGCLGHCEDGITAVIYPQAEWMLNLKNTDEDVAKIVAAIKSKLNAGS